MRRLQKLTGLMVGLLLLIPAVAFSGTTKMDPTLVLLAQKGMNQTIAKKGIMKAAPNRAEPMVSTLIRFRGALSGVEANGGKIRSILGDIATVDLPLSAVVPISQLRNILYIEAAKKVNLHLDMSVPATGADNMRTGVAPNWVGYTGRSVIIGIVDTGIDLNHPDFKDPSGKTRILYLWDQSTDTGTPPSGHFYGNECAQAVIDAGGCPETDTIGHGTHIAGIAAGNGSATGGGLPAYRYVGVAPEADLIVVNALNPEISPLVPSDDAILDGIAYIQAKAAVLGKPSVINLSLGSDIGPHDGTSLYERALDNASGVGKVIVSSAGNETGANNHASGIVAQGGSTTVGFSLPPGDVFEELDFWYSGADQMGISVGNGSCTTSIVNPGSTQVFESACGRITIVSSDVNPNNGDREIEVFLESGANPLAAGPWHLTLSGISIVNGRFDGWFSCCFDAQGRFTTNIDNSITLGNTATATKPISVGAYNTKNPLNDQSITVGDIASFSSRGPRRSCSNLTVCPSIQKPEIAAPGNPVMAALAANTSPSPPNISIDPDGVHVLKQGTSMAAPHVTGAVALLLQAAPSLTSDEIKTILTTKAVADNFTGAVPNNVWGYGKLSVPSAYAAIVNPLPAPPAGLSAASAGPGAVILSWFSNKEPTLAGYNIYRSASSGAGSTKVAFLSNTVSRFQDTQPTGDTAYFYFLRAVNNVGSESLNSKEVSAKTSAAPSTSGGGGGCVINQSGEADPMLAGIAIITIVCLLYRQGLRRFFRRKEADVL